MNRDYSSYSTSSTEKFSTGNAHPLMGVGDQSSSFDPESSSDEYVPIKKSALSDMQQRLQNASRSIRDSVGSLKGTFGRFTSREETQTDLEDDSISDEYSSGNYSSGGYLTESISSSE